MYGAEIWGCSRHLEAIEQVQLHAFRMPRFLVWAQLIPRHLYDIIKMEMLPLVCVQFRLHEGDVR